MSSVPPCPPRNVAVTGVFDDIRSGDLRFLEEAARLGPVTVLLWPDAEVTRLMGRPPRFPEAERRYFLEAVRYVHRVVVAVGPVRSDALPEIPGVRPEVWVASEGPSAAAQEADARRQGLAYHVLGAEQLRGFPDPTAGPSGEGGWRASQAAPGAPGEGSCRAADRRRRVVVTGCYDWFHSGHVRFFEEASAHGDLYVVVGHDANLRLLKGPGRPLFPQEERRYVVGSIRFVARALISSGEGWLDAEPEIGRIRPDLYLVNEDGDQGGKREYCARHGIEYLVLRRTPAPGLPPRSSTELRGF